MENYITDDKKTIPQSKNEAKSQNDKWENKLFTDND